MGRADYLALGDWNCVCYQCGRKRKASQMKKHWQGYWVCPEHWEPRQQQDFARAVADNTVPPCTQPGTGGGSEANTFLDEAATGLVTENQISIVTEDRHFLLTET